MGVKTAQEPVRKSPNEKISVKLDYDNGDHASGVSISSILESGVSGADSALTLSPSPTISGMIVDFSVNAGTVNVNYDIHARCRFSDGQEKDGAVVVEVRER
jgi:hypothetical protein